EERWPGGSRRRRTGCGRVRRQEGASGWKDGRMRQGRCLARWQGDRKAGRSAAVRRRAGRRDGRQEEPGTTRQVTIVFSFRRAGGSPPLATFRSGGKPCPDSRIIHAAFRSRPPAVLRPARARAPPPAAPPAPTAPPRRLPVFLAAYCLGFLGLGLGLGAFFVNRAVPRPEAVPEDRSGDRVPVTERKEPLAPA